MTIAVIAALFSLCVPSARLLRIRLKARGPRKPVIEGGRPDLLGVAYLMGGAGRVTDTVITGMQDDGRITLTNSRVKVVDPAARNSMERALLKQCSSDWSNSLRAVRGEMRRDAALEPIDRMLVKQGLLTAPDIRRLWPRAAVTQAVGLAVTAAVTLVLLFRSDCYPAPFILLALLVPGAVVRVKCRPRKGLIPRTDHGESVARELLTRGPWSVRDPGIHPEGPAGVVAVRGTGELTDKNLRKQFEDASKKRTSRSSSRRSSTSRWSGSSSSSSTIIVGASCGGTYDTSGSGSPSGSHSSSCSSSSASCSSSSSSCSSGSSCSSCGGGGCS
ncbi:TIGR04222 domain-containing membrane protein [Streptomyces sp. NPDC026206]|uniref:TIGR04222 domain-containing membrane protein n=1 Tax=Streptomyces sp. NPDC026206 TaxID=3157089 RepID=UPI0033D3DEA5